MYPGAHAESEPTRPAIVMAETGETLSFGELDEQANRLSHVFADLGLGPGDHVAFCLENRLAGPHRELYAGPESRYHRANKPGRR